MLFQVYEWIIFGCIIVITFLLLFNRRKKKNAPPGPPGRVLIGNTFLLKPKAFEILNELAKKYGPIYQFFFLGQPIIVLSDYEVIKDAFVRQGDIFSGRPKAHVWETYCSNSGIALNEGEAVTKLRKFSAQVFRRFGLGSGSLEEKVQKEVEFLCNYIKGKNSQPFDFKYILSQTSTNVIQSILMSSRVDYRASHKGLPEVIDELFEAFTMTNPVNFFPPLGYVLKSFRKYKNNIHLLREMMTNIIKEHEETFDSKNIRDYIDAYLEKEQQNEQQNIKDSSITRLHLLVTLTDCFLGGIESITNTMLWAILYLMHHPDIQKKVQKELDSVLGSNEVPKMSDRKDLPFTMATILEVQRYCNLVPLALTHYTNKSTNLCGYDIPKGAWIVPNLTAVHFDPKYWPEPHKFNPNRFLDMNGEVKQNIESFIPFSIGPRYCIGEPIAKIELFLIFSTLFKRFEFHPSTEEGLPSMTEKIETLVLRPLSFKCSAIPR